MPTGNGIGVGVPPPVAGGTRIVRPCQTSTKGVTPKSTDGVFAEVLRVRAASAAAANTPDWSSTTGSNPNGKMKDSGWPGRNAVPAAHRRSRHPAPGEGAEGAVIIAASSSAPALRITMPVGEACRIARITATPSAPLGWETV